MSINAVTEGAPAAPAPAAPAASNRDIVPETPAAPTSPAPTIEADIPAAKLAELTAKSKADREAKKAARAAAPAAVVPPVEPAKPPVIDTDKLGKAIASKDFLAAAAAAGISLEDAFEQWLANEQKDPASAATAAALGELQAKVDAVQKRLDDEAKADDEAAAGEAEAEKVKAVAEATTAVTKILADKIKAEATKYPRCARDPDAAALAAEDCKLAVKKLQAAEIAKKLGREPTEAEVKQHQRAISDEEAAQIFDLALAEREAHYAELGKRYYVPDAPERQRPRLLQAPRRETREVGTGESRQPTPTIEGDRRSLRSPAPEPVKHTTLKEAIKTAKENLRRAKKAAQAS